MTSEDLVIRSGADCVNGSTALHFPLPLLHVLFNRVMTGARVCRSLLCDTKADGAFKTGGLDS